MRSGKDSGSLKDPTGKRVIETNKCRWVEREIEIDR